MFATAIITVTAAVFSDYFTGGSCLPSETAFSVLPTVPAQHLSSISLRASTEPSGSKAPRTCRLGLGRCSATRVPHSPRPCRCRPTRPLGVKAWRTPCSPHPGQSLEEGARPGPEQTGRAAPPAGCVGAARRPPAGKTTAPQPTRGAHRPSGRVESLHDGWAARGQGKRRAETRRLLLGVLTASR